jgi:hypothetical protein
MKRYGLLLAALVLIAGFSGQAIAGYTYYSSYFTSESGYWTGVGVSNTSSSTIANVSVVVYDNNGTLQTTENQPIAANGTTSFIVGPGLSGVTGWMKISSDIALAGLCFFGTSDSNEYIADIPLAHTLATALHIPHAPQDTNWDTTIFLCNPNNSSNSFTIAYVDTQGQQVTSENYSLPAYGSGKYELQDILGQGISYSAGKVVITSTQGVTAFSLFKNTKTGKHGYGGIAAVDISDQGSGFTVGDIAGTWFLGASDIQGGHTWDGSITFDASGNVTGGSLNSSNGPSYTYTGGSLLIDSSGKVTGSVVDSDGITTTLTMQMDADKNLMAGEGNATGDEDGAFVFVKIWYQPTE